MNLHAIFVSHHHVICGPGVGSQDHAILRDADRKDDKLAKPNMTLNTNTYYEQNPKIQSETGKSSKSNLKEIGPNN